VLSAPALTVKPIIRQACLGHGLGRTSARVCRDGHSVITVRAFGGFTPTPTFGVGGLSLGSVSQLD